MGWPLGFQSEQTAMLISESGINIEKKASFGRRWSLISLLRDTPEYIQGPKIVSQHSLNETKERALKRATLVWGRGWRSWKRRGLQTWGGYILQWNCLTILGQQECPIGSETPRDSGDSRQGTLGELGQQVNDLGMKLGLWRQGGLCPWTGFANIREGACPTQEGRPRRPWQGCMCMWGNV